jgi:hypothetical protein
MKGEELVKLIDQEPARGDYLAAELTPIEELESLFGKAMGAPLKGALGKEGEILYGWGEDPDVIEGSDKVLRRLSSTILRSAGNHCRINGKYQAKHFKAK